MNNLYALEAVSNLVNAELDRQKVHGPFHGVHHMWGVLAEEMDEVWDLVRAKDTRRDRTHLLSELVQVAAVAIRAAADLGAVTCGACDGEGSTGGPAWKRCGRCGGAGQLTPGACAPFTPSVAATAGYQAAARSTD